MKNLLFLMSFVLFATAVQAQGNLQFNQVIYRELSFTITASIVNPSTQISITVPAGKVWKIEAAYTGARVHSSSSSFGSGYGYYSDGILSLNDRVIRYGGSDNPTLLPIWLPEGTYTLTYSKTCTPCYSNSVPSVYNGSISAIEFNIVP